jgi:hypothetical protein
MWLACRRSVDQAVLRWSAPRRTWSGSLAPLLFLGGTDGILLPDGAPFMSWLKVQLWKGISCSRILAHKPLAEQGYLLRIRVDMVRTILRKVYEPLVVLVHSAGTLLKVQELLLLAVYEVIRDVVPQESLTELSLGHLVAVRKGGGEGHPPGTHRPKELLGHEQRLLRLCAAEKTELSLSRAKLAIGLQRVRGLRKHRWVCHQEV